jgi:hypothetical protein
MARIRYIKHGFFTNEQLADCSAQARLLFAGLWIVADSAGRLEDRPRRLKAELFPFDDWDVNKMLEELCEAKLVLRYSVSEEHFIQVINFSKHQRPHPNEPETLIPPPFTDEARSEESGNETSTREKKLSVVKKHEEQLQSTERSGRNGDGNRNRNGDGKGTGVGARSRPAGAARASTVKLCDEEYLADLKNNPAYSGIDVERLYHKLVAWCQLKGKQPTRARFLGWLNREDVPMSATAPKNERKFVNCG